MPIDDTVRPHERFRALLLAVILLLLVLLIGMLLSVRNRSAGKQTTDTTNAAPSASVASATPVLPAPSVVNTYAGTVERMTGSTIVFTATVFDTASGRYTQRSLTAQLSGGTVFRTTADAQPAPPMPGQQSSSAFLTIGRSEIRRGDAVQVFSGENIAGRQSFPVAEVRRLTH